MNTTDTSIQHREPWNKGKLTGQKAPLRLRDIWAIRIHLQLARKVRDLALFDLAIDSKLRACDLVKLRVRDVGSANLTDRAWFKNYEAGVYLTDAELEHAGLILELENFFEGLASKSYELTQEEYERQEKQSRKRNALLNQLGTLERGYEDNHWKLSDRTSPISDDVRGADERRTTQLF